MENYNAYVAAFGGCIKPNIPDPPHGAGSFIKLGNGLIVVEDVWSGKLSLPGGGQKVNEFRNKIERVLLIDPMLYKA